MNGKPGESLDQWVRQSLDRLPDAPPPGSTFDADRLWSRLQPELQKPAVNRRFGWGWWAVAACGSGLLLLGWLLPKQQSTLTQLTQSSLKRSEAPVAISPVQTTTGPPRPESVRLTVTRRSFRPSVPHSEPVAGTLPTALPVDESVQPVAAVAEPPTSTDTQSTPTAQPESVAVIAVAAPPKRRFRVVHLNELRAEEAIRPTPHRTDHFVRLGTGAKGQPAPETAHPAITWPLTDKSTQ